MRPYIVIGALGLLAVTLASAQFGSGGFVQPFVGAGDTNGTVKPTTGFAVPTVTAVPANASPGYLAYVWPTDGTNACEGRLAIVTAAGTRCIEGVAP